MQPPRPEGAARDACRELAALLPETVDGETRRDTSPDSPYTAAWGDPAIVLSCGIEEPAVLVPGSPEYDPGADFGGINGVQWLFEQRGAGARYTTVSRQAVIRVTVPARGAARDGERPADSSAVDPLLDLADAVKRAAPWVKRPAVFTD